MEETRMGNWQDHQAMVRYQQQSALNRSEDKYLDPPEDEEPDIICDECGKNIAGEDRYEICTSVFCADCIDNFKIEGV